MRIAPVHAYLGRGDQRKVRPMATIPPDPNWHCRIGKIRPIGGGAEVRVLEPRETTEIADVTAFVERLPAKIRTNYPEGVIGCVALVWSGSGSSQCWYSVGNSSPIPWRLVPAYVHDRLCEEVNERNARDVANRVLDERLVQR